MKLLSLIIILFSLSLSAQDEYTSTIYIPLIVENSAVKELIDASTEEVMNISDSLEMSRYNYDLNVVDKETILKGNKITHSIEFVDGTGTQSTRSGISNPIPFGGKLYTPWVTLSCRDIKGFSTAEIAARITSDYKILTESSFTADINAATCNGMGMSNVMKLFGYDRMTDTMSYKMNQNLAEMKLRENIEKVWFDLQKPMMVDSSTYLIIDPEKLVYKDFVFEDNQLNFGIGIQLKMGVTNAEDAKRWNIFRPLPKLQKLLKDPEETIHISMPVKMDYQTIEKQVRPNIVGEFINREKKGKEQKIAEILDISISESHLKDFDVKVGVKVKFLKYFRKRKGFIYFHSKIGYDNKSGQLEITDYKIDSKTNSWLANTSIELMANLFIKKKMKSSMMDNLTDRINHIKTTLNDFMKSEVIIQEGITFTGQINHIEIVDILPRSKDLFLHFIFKGDIGLHVYKMPIPTTP